MKKLIAKIENYFARHFGLEDRRTVAVFKLGSLLPR